MPVSYIGNVYNSKLNLLDIFHVPKLSLNLVSVGQLTELSFNVIFSNHGCYVQDSQTGEILRTDHKVGCLFEVLRIPHKNLSNFVASASYNIFKFLFLEILIPKIQNALPIYFISMFENFLTLWTIYLEAASISINKATILHLVDFYEILLFRKMLISIRNSSL